MKRALLLLLSAAALCMASVPDAVAATARPPDRAAAPTVRVETDYDPTADVSGVAEPDLDTILGYFESDGGLMSGLRYIVILLFAH
jgi:hypothetical protein